MGPAQLASISFADELHQMWCHRWASGVAPGKPDGESSLLGRWFHDLRPSAFPTTSRDGIRQVSRRSGLAVAHLVDVPELDEWMQRGRSIRTSGARLFGDLPPGHLGHRSQVEIPGDPRELRRFLPDVFRSARRAGTKRQGLQSPRHQGPLGPASAPLTARA